MGRVFKAVHQTMSRVVALKVVASEPREERAGAQQMFMRQCAPLALMHPNIVTADANQIG